MSTGSEAADDAAQRPDTDDMLMIHQSFRREFALAASLVSSTPPRARSRARRVANHLSLVATSLHDHHAGEDAVLWPALRATNEVEPALLDDMLGEHHELADALTALERSRRAWARSPGRTRTEELAAVLTRVHAETTHHLDHEEKNVLPLVRAHLTVRDWDVLAAESRRRLPRSPRRQLLLLGMLLEDATPKQRDQVDEQMPAAARRLWAGVGRRYYARYVRRLRAPSTAAINPVPRRGASDAVQATPRPAPDGALSAPLRTSGVDASTRPGPRRSRPGQRF